MAQQLCMLRHLKPVLRGLAVRMVGFILGYLLTVVSVALLIPTAAGFAMGEPAWQAFAAASAVTAFVAGTLILALRSQQDRLYLHEGFLLTTMAWVVLPVFGALPFMWARLDLSLVDALFESVSGITTTGSTVVAGLDSLPRSILLWRSLLQWLGGIGIIAMGVAVLPFLRVGGMQLFHMESSDRSEKVMPRAKDFAITLLSVYVSLTLACAALYAIEEMTYFEAINHAMTTISTGGYSTSDASLGHFSSPVIQWTATLFMVLGALPFVLYMRFLKGEVGAIHKDGQVRAFVNLLALPIVGLTLWLVLYDGVPFFDALRLVSFNVVSITTTTGYASSDYTSWGTFSIIVFFFLTFVGGCSGSTAGGFKIYRYQILGIFSRISLKRLLFPNIVLLPKYAGRLIGADILRSVASFFFLYVGTILGLALALAFLGLDFETSLSGAATAVANVGPGLGAIIGPAGNFSSLPDAAKWLLIIGMILGRLELMSVFVLLVPAYWERRSS
ncbi:TrkH family potassium uptake protein [Limibacillus sp. MBR-115]|uniref:TrkH family potassium uptake protein n=1 Tax=Limibacillus sp. MBR-115 TaxID=3156465 RepID=UPI003393182E